jgi:hypothetical protein
MGDIIYNDLNAVHDNMILPTTTTAAVAGGELENTGTNDFDWMFGGDLGDDTVWQMLNQFQHGGGNDGRLGVVGEGAGA